MFEHSNFRSRTLTLRGTAPNLRSLDFSDRARSMIVKGGSWEACMNPDYRGRRRIFARGEYPTLDLGLNNQISSARPAAYNGENWSGGGSTCFGAGNGSIILYSDDKFEGKWRTLHGPATNFDYIGFNDVVSSLIVRRGVWDLCTDTDFRGTCRVYRPGEYPRLARASTTNSRRRGCWNNDGGRVSCLLWKPHT